MTAIEKLLKFHGPNLSSCFVSDWLCHRAYCRLPPAPPCIRAMSGTGTTSCVDAHEVWIVQCSTRCRVCSRSKDVEKPEKVQKDPAAQVDITNTSASRGSGFVPGSGFFYAMHSMCCDFENLQRKRMALTPRSDPFFINPADPMFRGTTVRQKRSWQNGVNNPNIPALAIVDLLEPQPFLRF